MRRPERRSDKKRALSSALKERRVARAHGFRPSGGCDLIREISFDSNPNGAHFPVAQTDQAEGPGAFRTPGPGAIAPHSRDGLFGERPLDQGESGVKFGLHDGLRSGIMRWKTP